MDTDPCEVSGTYPKCSVITSDPSRMAISVADDRAELSSSAIWSTFDAVLMLTFSDWKTEPRSNRYHYATRFAARLPVYFVQPNGRGDEVTIEPVEGHDITLVQVADDYGPAQATRLARAFTSLGIRRPLLWVYNFGFEHLVRRANARLVIYHATEDYFAEGDSWTIADDSVRAALKRLLPEVDLLVGVSGAVTQSYIRNGYRGRALTLRNGCDFRFWDASGASAYMLPDDEANVALFQGGINARLDYELLSDLADKRSDWQFWFCGQARGAGAEWKALAAKPNVRYYGALNVDGIADLARRARIGLIPFMQDKLIRNSLPLKAYEYVACGLPVVTVPIDELAAQPDLFRTETDADGFAKALDELAPTRTDPQLLTRRRSAASATSYDERFDRLEVAVSELVASRAQGNGRLNLLIFYDDFSTHIRTIGEHIEAIQKYSRHRVMLMPATGAVPGFDDREFTPDLSVFDAVLIHYSVRVSLGNHISTSIARAISQYNGPKLLFIQDEYENTETARRWIARLGVTTIFTNVPLDQIDRVYPRARFPRLDFVPTLTGYVPEDHNLDSYALPIAERPTLIGYRGRKLSHQYGQLGYEKFRIGVEVKRLAVERHLPVDIEVADSKRIYGNEWYAFLGSCRATLGSESGANLFDDDGSLKQLAAEHAYLPFPEFSRRFLAERDGEVQMAQVSPKIFEAIRLRTALILFEEGRYSGVVTPGLHFIPLKKDFSNIEEVFAKVQDVGYLERLTDRAYHDVIGTGHYSYETFVKGVDAHIDERSRGRARAKIVSVPVLAAWNGELPMPLQPELAGGLMCEVILDATVLTRETVHALVTPRPKATTDGTERLAETDAYSPPDRQAVGVHSHVGTLRGYADAASSFLRRCRERGDLVRALLGDAGGRRVLWLWLCDQVGAKPFLVDAARMLLARKLRARAGSLTEAVALLPHMTDEAIEIHVVPQSVAAQLGLIGVARTTLTDAANRGAEDYWLVLGREATPRPPLIANDRYPLPQLAQWLRTDPETVVQLVFGSAAEPAGPPATELPKSATHYLDSLSAAGSYPDLLPLLHDLARRRLGAGPALPFNRDRLSPDVAPGEPRRRSVLFLNQCYYNFKYLAAALRDRGWDALVANLYPPDGLDAKYYHGEDLGLYDPDPVQFRKRLQEFFDEACNRFGIVHSYGVGTLSLFPEMWDTEPTHAAIPWDILEWRRRGILIGYTHVGCCDGVSQSAFGAWSPGSCARCPWRERSDICSDSKNLAWGRKLETLADLICVETDVALDHSRSPKAFRDPLTMALDPEIWRPDLEPPEHLRRTRTRDDEVLVYHGVGNYEMRTRDGINIKGTRAVVAAIKALREEGIPVRLDFVDDVPSIDNRFVQAQADIIVDQLNYGRYGATAREGMMLGKPVVARINPWDGDGIPATRCILETPVVNADEGTIKDVLRDLVLDPAKRAVIGRASREHALKWWSAPRLAQRFERVYDIVRETGQPPRTLD